MEKKKENPLFTLVFSIALPTWILNKASAPEALGPQKALLLAVSIPLLYGAFDYLRRREHNLLAAIGLVGIAVSGGLGLFQMDGFWFAVKEAAIPTLLGLLVLGSAFFGKPIISKVLLNAELLDLEKLNGAIAGQQAEGPFSSLLKKTNALLGASFFLSAVLNFGLALMLLKSPAGSVEFNQELAKMNALSFVVIALPSMACVFFAMWFFFRGVRQLTGLSASEVLRKAD